jgi:hypothetical protein
MGREKRKSCFEKIDIYPVTCERLSCGRSDLEVPGVLIEGGARIVQLLCVSACKSCLRAFAPSRAKVSSKNPIVSVHLGEINFQP